VADELARRIVTARLIRRCGCILIDALAELEEIRKRRWLGRPLVLESHWCVTLDRVPAELYPQVARNAAQLHEWQRLFALDQLSDRIADGKTNAAPHASRHGALARDAILARPSPDLPRTHPSLVVDTRHFDRSFTDTLLASFDDLDAATDGLAIHGESFRALRLLEPRYRGVVKCAPLDPPYNTGSAALSYSDRLSHSAWLALMRDRLQLARGLLSEDGAVFVMLDDHEQARLRLLLEGIFGERNFVATIVWEKVHTRKNSARHFSVSHDYILACARNKDAWRRQLLPREQTEAYANPDADPRGPWKPDPVYANKPYDVAYRIEKPNGVRLDPPPGQFWRFSPDTFAAKVAGREVLWGDGSAYPLVKRYLADVQQGLVPVTLFTRGFAGDNGLANAELSDLFGPGRPVAYPKPTRLIERLLQIATSQDGDDVVLDFFAGSGTTAQAVMSQNDRDGGRRKYVLVERGPHFDTVLRPRLMKAMYSRRWRGGRPLDQQGTSHLFNHVRIESYDDPVESPSDRDFRRPLRRAPAKGRDRRPCSPRVDLIASFNFLLGLRVRRQTADADLHLVWGVDSTGLSVLIVWRNVDATDDDALCQSLSAHIDRDAPPEIVYVNGCDDFAGGATARLARRVGAREVRVIDREFERLRNQSAGDAG
jgi:adenine-specific DNA-methyltransferase